MDQHLGGDGFCALTRHSGGFPESLTSVTRLTDQAQSRLHGELSARPIRPATFNGGTALLQQWNEPRIGATAALGRTTQERMTWPRRAMRRLKTALRRLRELHKTWSQSWDFIFLKNRSVACGRLETPNTAKRHSCNDCESGTRG